MMESRPEARPLTPGEAFFTRGEDALDTTTFHLRTALEAQYDATDTEYTQLEYDVLGHMLLIAEDLRLEPQFFDNPTAVMLLMSIAERWVANERTTGVAERSLTIADREMLVDAAMRLTDEYSAEVIEIADVSAAEKAALGGEVKENQQEYEAFLEQITNPRLTELVTDFYASTDALHPVYEYFGIEPPESPNFEVKVLDLDPSHYLKEHIATIARTEGPLVKPHWPNPVEQSIVANFADTYFQEPTDKYTAEELAAAAPLIAYCHVNTMRYKDKFEKSHGKLPGAWATNSADGRRVVYLYASHAFAALDSRHMYERSLTPAGDDHEPHTYEYGTLLHEVGHTDRRLIYNNHYGRGIEEIKAETVGGNKSGYLEVKKLFAKLDVLTWSSYDQGLRHKLDTAVKRESAQADFYAAYANALGLKSLFLFMADAPQEYREDDTSGQYLNLNSQLNRARGDRTIAETIIRDAEEALGVNYDFVMDALPVTEEMDLSVLQDDFFDEDEAEVETGAVFELRDIQSTSRE